MALNFFRSIWTEHDKPLGGRYQIVEELGSGGFGQTFKAKDLHLPDHPLCVVKQLKPQVNNPDDLQIAHRLFDTEARTLYRLGDHPQIPRLLAHFSDGRDFYLVQELIEGHSLSYELETETSWAVATVVALLGDILETLAFVHDNRVIHRDLKPSNLIRRAHDRRIVLIDFGAVKQASTQLVSSNTGITHTISIGTQGYMPNEQLAGTPTFSSDIYAVGMIGIQALTGRHPRTFATDPLTGEIDWHHHAPAAPATLVAVLDRMVKYDFRARYLTATDALAALRALPAELTQHIPSPLAFHQALNQHAGSVAAPPNSPPPSVPLPATKPDGNLSFPATQSDEQAAQLLDDDIPNNAGDDDSEALKPTQLADQATNPLAETLPVLGRRQTDRGSSFHPTRPLLKQGRSPARSSSPPRLPPTRRSPAPSQTAISAVAIALALGLGALAWRIVGPDPSSVPTSTLSTNDVDIDGANPDPNNLINTQVDQLLQQAQSLRKANQYDQALAAYDEAIALNGESSPAHSGRCYSLNRLGRYDEAMVACDRAIALDDTNVDALLNKGFTLDQQKRHNESLALYEQALAIDPDYANAWSNKGTALHYLGRHQEAVSAYDRALELNPNLAEAWSGRGTAFWDLRQFESALASVERAVEIQPDYQDAIVLRQEMRKRLGRE